MQVHAGLKLKVILLPQPLEYWGHVKEQPPIEKQSILSTKKSAPPLPV